MYAYKSVNCDYPTSDSLCYFSLSLVTLNVIVITTFTFKLKVFTWSRYFRGKQRRV